MVLRVPRRRRFCQNECNAAAATAIERHVEQSISLWCWCALPPPLQQLCVYVQYVNCVIVAHFHYVACKRLSRGHPQKHTHFGGFEASLRSHGAIFYGPMRICVQTGLLLLLLCFVSVFECVQLYVRSGRHYVGPQKPLSLEVLFSIVAWWLDACYEVSHDHQRA